MATSTCMPTNVPKIKKSKLKLVKKIGTGGFGAVFQATWKSPEGKIQVAAKRLNDPDPHELTILASLDHKSIVKLLGFVDEDMDFMLVLELCEGGSLREYLDKHGGLSSNQELFIHWAKQAAIPIKYLRGKQIVHKDVKSPNYLITRNNTLKLADFGLAKKIEHTISNATERASFPWMAPELFTLNKLSPNYDIFALGVVIWELWTGEIPFKGLQFQVIAWRVCHEKERLPIPADMPQPIADLLRQCWDETWHKRPSIEDIISIMKTGQNPACQQEILAGDWLLEKRIDIVGDCNAGSVRDITVSPNGDIAIITSSPIVNVVSSDGVYKGSMDITQIPGFGSILRQITTSSDGSTYFMTDTRVIDCVLMYSADFKFKGQWKSSCPQVPSDTPCLYGLAVDDKDHVYVGDIASKYINKHKQDGSYVTSIKVGIEPKYLIVTSQDTIIVGESGNNPQIVSTTGHVLHTLKHPKQLQLRCTGMYCYRNTVFIANRTNEIICYTIAGQYLGCITTQDFNPSCIAMMANGTKMIVGDAVNRFCGIFALQS